MNIEEDKNNHIIKDIISTININGIISDKDVLEMKEKYNETKFLTAFNYLVENNYIQSQHLVNNTDGLAGKSEKYILTELGSKLIH
jgi:hypothetical protein